MTAHVKGTLSTHRANRLEWLYPLYDKKPWPGSMCWTLVEDPIAACQAKLDTIYGESKLN